MNTSNRPWATILIVEDLDWIRSGMKSAVRRLGHVVAEATDAAEAIKAGEAEPPDLILTEEELPTFDSLMTRLSQHPTLRDIPVIIINPDADEHTHYGDAVVLNCYEQLPSLLLRRAGTHEDE